MACTLLIRPANTHKDKVTQPQRRNLNRNTNNTHDEKHKIPKKALKIEFLIYEFTKSISQGLTFTLRISTDLVVRQQSQTEVR